MLVASFAKSTLPFPAHVHVTDDPAWAKKRLLDPKTTPSRPSAWLLHLAGDALIDKYPGRLDSIDARFLVQQLEKVGSKRASSALLRSARTFGTPWCTLSRRVRRRRTSWRRARRRSRRR